MDAKDNKRKEELIKPELPGGFRDALPEDMIAKQKMIDTIRTVFERFGFDPMETPAVEKTEVLIGGEKASGKIIFNVIVSEDEKSDTSLRFDLTVPLARVLAANPDIPKPFKRYQIGKAWRGERQQTGRYREFLQMDVDILGAKSLDADAEIIQVMYETLKALGVDDFAIRLNNKNEIVELLKKVGVADDRVERTLIEIDKEDKRTPEEWASGVKDASGLEGESAESLLQKISNDENPGPEVQTVRKKALALGVPDTVLKYDASLVRGLGYYTGSTFEVVLNDLPRFGSVFSGGRYDGLTARFSRESWLAVGSSMGVDRLFAALEELGKIKREQTLNQVLIMNLSDDYSREYSGFARDLRNAGINTTLYLGDDKAFSAQLAYAVKKEIPFVIIYGEKEAASGKAQIKDLRRNIQTETARAELAGAVKELLKD